MIRLKLFIPLILISTGVVGQPQSTVRFKKHIIHQEFISEGVAVADVNNDGLSDILAGPCWFEAPDWEMHQISKPVKFDYTKEWSDSFLNFATDINEDGWVDLIVFDFPGTEVHWFENPQESDGFWTKHLIDSTARNESPMLVDIDHDTRADLVFGTGKDQLTWFEPVGRSNITWERRAISLEKAKGASTFSHGLGFGDLNKDGKHDIITTNGWWTSHTDLSTAPWTYHPVDLGEPCSQMYVYDLDLDGDHDVVSASAHDYGIWWHEQTDPGIFKTILIDSTFSQTHGLVMKDLNGDNLPDLITGKRFFAHNGKDPGGKEPAVLYWYELKHDEDRKPFWMPHLIDDNSGVGLQLVVQDLDGDNHKDIVIANKKGVFLFESY